MSVYRAAQVATAGGPFEIVERDVPHPGPCHVRVAVDACGVCHSDAFFVNGALPGVRFPVVPGHEIAGRIVELGEGTQNVWQVGDRVAVGWFGGSCGHCTPCRQGDFMVCQNLKVPGWSYDGGYAETVIAPVDALARIPDALDAVDAAPMGCAGVTTYNGLRRSSARPGDLVAVLGIGGLGHLGVQYAAAMGFETVAIARGAAKADFAKELGAHHYIDSTADTTVADALQALGGAKVVLATASASGAITATVGGLAPRGELVVIGADSEPLGISPTQLLMSGKVVRGHPSGTAQDVQDTLAFSVLHGIRPMTETVPLDGAAEAYQKMLSGAARFRMVLTTA
ncbi:MULTISPECIES: alcohol dehydrogenase [unclassified Streptomyces]|uniref:alcohol dehydrogenase n=1 Tax=unclassified Streptomyces TaxID=2593676 RepID=UPI0022596131|nr:MULTISPECIES: alcohol dehydrogenase [unclassified Streptomyces]WSP57616.1 alcohol dehydrogenase [Streptomyces sp. NBC_01241]WSU21653.1 alcohol dehydrogenase [Streptomyces sp. NBC_01108]MCX4789483.1 alcohol dehydrogenase [Streptomyces sp. NBC_01221]MCX4794796.1 alcohol dehydrogenase [Streptomyces sp. NBC_01242]WSJ36113.1 alcohol dehydrogenase [Streptomyces sp. NBC_01321]